MGNQPDNANAKEPDARTQREAEELALGYGIPAAAEQHRDNGRSK